MGGEFRVRGEIFNLRNSLKHQIQDRLDKNLTRAKNLVNIYENYAPNKTKKVEYTDLLRAATVFLHATLEDFLRSIAAWKLPSAEANTLNKIPLPLAGKEKPVEKFSLGDLVQYREKRVTELIDLAVNTSLERSNYNNTNEITDLLRGIGITTDNVNSSYPKLTELMERRHQIVHRADRKPETGKVSRLRKGEVNSWIRAVGQFAADVLNEIPN
jgi:hypothetical protein